MRERYKIISCDNGYFIVDLLFGKKVSEVYIYYIDVSNFYKKEFIGVTY